MNLTCEFNTVFDTVSACTVFDQQITGTLIPYGSYYQ